MITEATSSAGSEVVARLHLTSEADLELIAVVWTSPTPLPTRYATAADVVDALRLWAKRPKPATKPIPIPHFAPVQ